MKKGGLMRKTFFIPFLLVLFCVTAILSGCGKKENPRKSRAAQYQSRAVKSSSQRKAAVKKPTAGGVENVCQYFPKDLVEKAIGRPIVKMEQSMLGSEVCEYYTSYSPTYTHTPYGDQPGGPHVVAVYDYKDFAKDRVINEKHGSVYASDPSISMENFVVRSHAGKIWQTVLALGDEKYLRIKVIHDAVTGDELAKIAKEFAKKIKRK